MKSYKEMRREAWKTATTRWSFRMLSVYMFYIAVAMLVNGALTWFFKDNGVVTWADFEESRRSAAQSGLAMTVPTLQQKLSMTWASGFSGFLQLLIQSLMVFGIVSVALNAVRGRSEGWFHCALGGFRSPLAMIWLNVVMSLLIALWSLIFVIPLLAVRHFCHLDWFWLLPLALPVMVAALRYALAWYVKSEHPDLSAWKCIAESRRLMRGHELELALFGLSYWGWILLALGGMIAAAAVGVALAPFAPVAMPLAILFMLFVMSYVIFGQAVFYTEAKRISENHNTENSKADASAESADS